MRLRQQYLTRNDCFQAARPLQVQGVMVHSTGADNPRVCRYVPGDEELGRNTAGNHWDQPGITKCVHAFIGKFAGGEVGTVQTLPWEVRGWHCARGQKGSGNNTHIGFEICEDSLSDPAYFAKIYQEAAELTAYLCKEFGLDPLADGAVICHQEGYQRGIASNHGDVLHWFPKFGKTMDDFRGQVSQLMKGEDEEVTYEQWKEFMEQYRKELRELPAGMPELLADAKAMGLTDGFRPRDLVTREEAAVMARAAAKQ
ncbi:N-acetylmuramoyl-L-alanine amidase [Pseudoflavonifractor sp. 60]|uniref:peptidoglycan recognition protein family protein n=1 Tax=Pseudoflavonifractor sp. 60 TaxID=2304576 RepID=UPI001368C981|nr:peptidoglycan recognition family protein [Pseudoflavonifractor sp. 60]NBI66494.1 N-acetylmuramoyl-L-alanine amidase [Pseudoflavonifractor sp. 60]